MKGASSPRERAEPTEPFRSSASIFFLLVVRTRANRKEIVMQENASRLPARPSLEQLQKQARELLGALQAGNAEARERFRTVSPRADTTRDAVLADAQFVIAREHGFETWARLKQHVNAVRIPALAPFEQLAHGLAEACAKGDREAAQAPSQHPRKPRSYRLWGRHFRLPTGRSPAFSSPSLRRPLRLPTLVPAALGPFPAHFSANAKM